MGRFYCKLRMSDSSKYSGLVKDDLPGFVSHFILVSQNDHTPSKSLRMEIPPKLQPKQYFIFEVFGKQIIECIRTIFHLSV